MDRIVNLKTSRGMYIYPRPDAVVSQRWEPYAWKVIKHGGCVAFQVTSGDTSMYMAADPGIGGGVFVRHTLAGWEEWKIADGIITSFHGTNLSANKDAITLTNDKTGKETITIYEELGKEDIVVYLKTFHGTYIHVAEEGVVKHGDNKTGWLVVKRDGKTKVYLQMTEGNMKMNMYLSADPGTWEKVHVRHTLQGWEKWTLERSNNNGIFLKSYHGTYVSCDEKKTKVRLGPNAKGWETLTPVSADGAPLEDPLSIFSPHVSHRADEYGNAYDPRNNRRNKKPDVNEYENFTKFIVMKDKHGNAFINYSGQLYEHLKPKAGMRRLPSQSIGTCYFFAAMHVIMNEEDFLDPFLKFLRSQIETNPYSRKSGESVQKANERRFGKGANIDITISKDAFVPSKDNMNHALDKFENNKDLFLWARHVILYYMITGSGHKSGKEYDSQAAVLMEDWSEMHRGSNKYKKALKDVGHGGWPLKALYDILRLSGVEVGLSDNLHFVDNVVRQGSIERGGLIARVPGFDVALCVGSRSYVRSETALPDDASVTGMYVQGFSGHGLLPGLHWITGAGHAMAYVRNENNQPDIIDSNGGTMTINEVHSKYKWAVGSPTMFIFDPAYTCKIPSTDFHTIGVQKGGADDDIDLIRSQSLLLMPEHAESVMTCTDDACTMDDELKAALMVVSSFVDDDTDTQEGGGYSLCWAALSAVIMGLAVLQG